MISILIAIGFVAILVFGLFLLKKRSSRRRSEWYDGE